MTKETFNKSLNEMAKACEVLEKAKPELTPVINKIENEIGTLLIAVYQDEITFDNKT